LTERQKEATVEVHQRDTSALAATASFRFFTRKGVDIDWDIEK